MTKSQIEDAIRFLQKVYVGQGEVDRLEQVIQALQAELQRRKKK